MAVDDAGDDLRPESVAAALPDRPVRAYPALLSTEADAQAWARAGAPAGAVVVADYQASPRGRAGLPWEVTPGSGLGFSLVIRPDLPAEAEGWPYVPATLALAILAGDDATITWPDEVHTAGRRVAAVGIHPESGPEGVDWAVVTVLVTEAQPPRADLLATTVAAIEDHLALTADALLDAYRPRCATFGRRVRARLIPLGPSSTSIEGTAADVRPNGGLVIDTDDGRRAVVPPQDLGMLDLLD